MFGRPREGKRGYQSRTDLKPEKSWPEVAEGSLVLLVGLEAEAEADQA